jgi:type I restriction enzyme S subunit
MTQGNKNVGWVSDSVTQQNRSQTTDQEASVLGYAALSQSKSGLPKGWVYARIGDVAAKTVQRVPHEKDEFIYVDIGSIDRNLKIISEPQTLLGKDAPSRARKIINTGDILVSLTRPNLNAVALIEQEFDNQIASTGFEVIKPILVDSRYIFAIVRSNEFIDAISKKVQGALYPAAKSDDVRQYEFLLPPLAEQHQIAAKLDELMAQVDSIKTRLDTIPKILKRFRQSVLAAAVSGRLTEDWRIGNANENAEKLLAQLLEKNTHKAKPYEPSIPPFEISGNWQWARLGDIFIIKSGTTIKAEHELDYGDYPYFKVGDMNALENSFLMQKTTKFASKEQVSSKSLIDKGAIVFPKRGGAISTNKKRILAQASLVDLNTMSIIVNSPMSVKYTYYWFLTIDLARLNTGSTVPQINNGDIEPLWVPIPPTNEQTEIVRRVEQLFTYADQIEQRVKDAQARVNHLTQSILAKAFRGELTADWRAQNSDLISGENSAEALLAKIQAQRLKEKPKTGRKARA